MIVTSQPDIGEEEKAAVFKVFNEDQMLVQGKEVDEFEKEFASYIGTNYAIAVDSGTHALMIAIKALDIKGKILTTPITFSATAGAIVSTGCTPVFCDINPRTYNIDIQKMEKTLNKNPDITTIIPVHFAGLPCDMTKINELAYKHNCFVIEDACQAHGALHKGEKVGGLSDVGCFSFYATKNMTCGGNGGMITTNDEDIKNLCISYREHGRSIRQGANYPKRIGYNARMSTILAAIARVQLKKLDSFNLKRMHLASFYDEELKGFQNKFFRIPRKQIGRVYHLYVITTSARDKLKNEFQRNNIHCGIHYPYPLHLTPAFEQYGPEKRLVNAELFTQQCLSLPLYPGLKEDDVYRVCRIIKTHYGAYI